MAILSLFCLIAGVALAGFAPDRPIEHVVVETIGLVLIVLGLVTLGG